MIKCIEFPDKTFESKEEMFDALIKNEKLIIAEKCAKIYNESSVSLKNAIDFVCDDENIKSYDGFKKGFIYPIISTTRFFDSHKDVHFDGCFTKTVKDQQGKVHYCLDHELRYDSIIAWDWAIKMVVKDIPWSMVNKSYSGTTQALVFEIKEEDFKRKDVLEDIKANKTAFQNSIRMIYIKLKLEVNSTKIEHKENKQYYDDNIDKIANKEDVEENGYFWGVEELGIRREGSLVTAGGSNSATSIYQKENTDEPLKDTQTEDTKEDSRLDTINKEEFRKLLFT